MSESKTPRTDALLIEINEGRTYDTVGPLSDHARQLESQLNEALDYIAYGFDPVAHAILKKHGRIK